MGDTHHRSNLREHSAGLVVDYTTGSFVDCNVGTLTSTGNVAVTGYVSGANVRGTNYFRLGTDVYIISGTPASFDNAGVSAAATGAAGLSLGNLGNGTMLLSASLGHEASTCFMIVNASSGTASWCNVQSGALLS